MRNKTIKRYVKERDEMLMKCSVDELRKFVETHKVFYDPVYIAAFRKASDEVLEMTLHKMIVNCTNLPFELRAKSAAWLIDKGLSLDIGGRI